MEKNIAIRPGEFLLPVSHASLPLWACVACDQFTSQKEYWEQVERLVGSAPSAYRLILPECYLNESDARIPQIQQTLARYLEDGTLQSAVQSGYILVERDTDSGTRQGLMALLDLEQYDYHAGAKSLVRATEGTIESRIPPRLHVRKDAPLELSHVLVLIDDPMQTVLEPLSEKRGELPVLYDFPLMMDGGHLTGYAVTDEADIRRIEEALLALKAAQGEDALLFAVGDGNHSLATAKAHWEALKPLLSEGQQLNHPARYAMVEIENIHDDALVFEPIHRVLFGYDGDTLLDELHAYMAQHGLLHAPETDLSQDEGDVLVVFEGKEARLSFSDDTQSLVVGTLQVFLDDFMARHPECALDYVHGEETVRALVKNEKAVGFLLPALDKLALFPAVKKDGALPRKTFSMGEANEKRYYMEARKIK